MTASPGAPDLATLDLPALHGHLLAVIGEAAKIALAAWRPGARTGAEIYWKDGGSPVTAADLAVNAFLCRELPRRNPLAFHSEEMPESWRGPDLPAYVVDPIDGTRNFMEGGDAWCLVVGIVAAGVPQAGVIAVPARGQTISAYRGGGAWLNGQPLPPLALPSGSLRATGPRSLIESLATSLPGGLEPARAVPALAHRLVTPVKDEADLALARGGGHDWDIAAAHAILAECGGDLTRIDGAPIEYRMRGGLLPPMIAGHAGLLEKIRPTLLTGLA